MKKNKLAFNILPLNHFLIGFSYITGVDSENDSIGVDEFSLGFGLISITYTRIYDA